MPKRAQAETTLLPYSRNGPARETTTLVVRTIASTAAASSASATKIGTAASQPISRLTRSSFARSRPASPYRSDAGTAPGAMLEKAAEFPARYAVAIWPVKPVAPQRTTSSALVSAIACRRGSAAEGHHRQCHPSRTPAKRAPRCEETWPHWPETTHPLAPVQSVTAFESCFRGSSRWSSDCSQVRIKTKGSDR